jgi:hypothetical protein
LLLQLLPAQSSEGLALLRLLLLLLPGAFLRDRLCQRRCWW